MNEGRAAMRRLVFSMLCGGVALIGCACATKSFVRDQINATETRLNQQVTSTETSLSQRADVQEAKLREAAGETRQAIDTADQRLNGLDMRVGDVGARASGAATRADLATAATRDAEARLSQRLAGRNRYRLLETKVVHFESGQIEIRGQDANELESVAKALTADPNAVLELQGFTDSRGSDQYNRDLARERVEAVMRYLVQRHGVPLRQLSAISMGKVVPGAGEKPSREALASARRVDLRLFAPWSSWEDAQSASVPATPEPTATVAPEPRTPSAVSALPVQPEVVPSSAAPVDPARGSVMELLKTITPRDLGGRD
jgi:outer membrane protein OmpA-like peptidoglycan-associated protein